MIIIDNQIYFARIF